MSGDCNTAPPGFAETFAAGGWRAIDRRYGAKTERLQQWIAATSAPAATAAWDQAFAAWRRAEEFSVTALPSAGNCQALEDEEQRLWRRLILMPSPTPAALFWKLDYLWPSNRGADEYCDSWSDDIVQSVMADIRQVVGVHAKG